MKQLLVLGLLLAALGLAACHDEESRECTRNGQQVPC